MACVPQCMSEKDLHIGTQVFNYISAFQKLRDMNSRQRNGTSGTEVGIYLSGRECVNLTKYNFINSQQKFNLIWFTY